jgi:hypothetical protein
MEVDFVSLISSWGPLLIILVFFLFFARRGGMLARGPSGRTMIELYERQLEEMQRTNALLERLVAALEARTAR